MKSSSRVSRFSWRPCQHWLSGFERKRDCCHTVKLLNSSPFRRPAQDLPRTGHQPLAEEEACSMTAQGMPTCLQTLHAGCYGECCFKLTPAFFSSAQAVAESAAASGAAGFGDQQRQVAAEAWQFLPGGNRSSRAEFIHDGFRPLYSQNAFGRCLISTCSPWRATAITSKRQSRFSILLAVR